MELGFPWEVLPRVTPADDGLAAWIAAVGWRWQGAAAAQAEAGDVIVEVRSGGAVGWVAVPGPTARAIADVALARGAELAAPRPVTPVERALAALAIAEAVAAIDAAATVALVDAVPVSAARAAVAAIARPVAGVLRVIAGAGATWPAAAVADLARLPAVRVAVAAARARCARGRLRGLAARDVVVLGPPDAALVVGRGSIAAVLDRATGLATVAGPYLREPTLSDADPLLDDLPITLTIVVGEVDLPARELVALAPGRTVALGRPVGGTVELRAGGRVVGRGELVVVDGDLGVRLLDVLSPAAPAC